MRDARAWIFLAVGLLLAGLTGVALYGVANQAAGQGGTGGRAAAVPTVDVLVAKSDLLVRTKITADLIAHRDYPRDLVPAGAITNEADAIGQTTIAPIARGQTITAAQLSRALGEGTQAPGLTIETGKVMVAFPTSDPLTSAGLVNVGDRVDILASIISGSGENAKVSQTTLQNLEVIDLLGPTKEQPQKATSLVFAVDHQVALVLKYLRDSQATIDLAIRSRAENELIRTTSVDLGWVRDTYGFRNR
jgi:Flp pilus assembly protein CpaB